MCLFRARQIYLAAAFVTVPARYTALIFRWWNLRVLPDDAAFEPDGRGRIDIVVLYDAHRLYDVGWVAAAGGLLERMVDYTRWGRLSVAVGPGPLVTGAVLDSVMYVSCRLASIIKRI